MDSPCRPAEKTDTLFSLNDFLLPPRRDYRNVSAPVIRDFRHWSVSSLQRDNIGALPDILDSKWFVEVKREICSAVKGGILLDLGGGRGTLARLAAELGAGVYINVDLLPPSAPATRCDIRALSFDHLQPTTNLVPHGSAFIGATQLVAVQADMLDFLSRVPDASVHVAINGINTSLIDQGLYHKALVEEIGRVAKVGGIVFGSASSCLFPLKRQGPCEELPFRGDDPFFLSDLCFLKRPAP